MDAFVEVLAEDEIDLDFERIFRSWELQKGYPVVHVTYDEIAHVFRLTQERYFTEVVADDTSSWYIPLNFATASDPNFADTTITDYFVDGEESLEIPAGNFVYMVRNIPQWYVFNKQQFGYYRVNYDYAGWTAISDVLNSENYEDIHVLNRAQLLDDSYTFSKDGNLADSISFEVLTYLLRETEFTPFEAAQRYIDELHLIFGNQNENLSVSLMIFVDDRRIHDFLP